VRPEEILTRSHSGQDAIRVLRGCEYQTLASRLQRIRHIRRTFDAMVPLLLPGQRWWKGKCDEKMEREVAGSIKGGDAEW